MVGHRVRAWAIKHMDALVDEISQADLSNKAVNEPNPTERSRLHPLRQVEALVASRQHPPRHSRSAAAGQSFTQISLALGDLVRMLLLHLDRAFVGTLVSS